MPKTKRTAVVKKFDFDTVRGLQATLLTTIYVDKINSKKIQWESKTDRHFKICTTFDYLNEFIRFSLTSGHIKFVPVATKLSFMKQSVTEVHYDSKDVVKCLETFNTQVSFENCNIDFFGFKKDRIFIIEFFYKIPSYPLLFASKFSITLPVIPAVELVCKHPKTVYPNNEIRNICNQEFQMSEKNSVKEIQLCMDLEIFKRTDLSSRYHGCGYLKMLRMFLNIENSFEQILADKCKFTDAKLIKVDNGLKFRIMTPWPITNQADKLRLTDQDDANDNFNNNIDEGKKVFTTSAAIISYEPKSVTIQIPNDSKVIKKIDRADKKFIVELLPNFFTSAMAFMALQSIEEHKFEIFFLDFHVCDIPVPIMDDNLPKVSNFAFLNNDVGANGAQSNAIKHIVNRTSFPSPYVIFGPPGTGKTSTIVEAVSQIVERLPSARTIITVNSNSACDEIGDRLLKYIGHNKVYRYYSPSFERKMERVHHKLRSCSNLRYGYHVQPSLVELMSYNVVICTLVNSGRLIGKIPSDHFDFVIIDEAASCAEAYVAIPLSLTMSKQTKFKASIVLAGDHKQLGQIMRTHFSEVYGFQISIMERVMDMPNYKFNENSSGYDANYITQLTDNFRSHEAILDFSNKNFYNSILKAKQDKQIANFAVGWDILPNKNVPLIFQASWTPSQMDGTSHFNHGEIYFVKYYVRLMMQVGINGKKISAKNIGIISPYAIHREKLKAVLPVGIEIGTVEYFQGREKLIIILSCVRSKTKTVGFLNNQKRLNVALTRAKGLLIVIGNPETLGKNKMWRRFITNCVIINARIGKIPNWVSKRGKKEMEYEEDSDEIVRLEEFMNGLAIED